MYRPACHNLAFTTNGYTGMRLDGSELRVGADLGTANSNMGTGISICQNGCDNQIFALKSSDVSTGLTSFVDGCVEVDDYMTIAKMSASEGGVKLSSMADATMCRSFTVMAYVGADNTAKTTGGVGTVQFQAIKHDGANGDASFTANTNILAIRATDNGSGRARFLFDVEGSGHADVEFTTYDDHCDIELLRGVHGALVPCYTKEFGQDMIYNLCSYEDMGLIGKDSVHWEDRSDGRHQLRGMVNFTNLAMLHHSTIIQLADRFNARLDGIETQLKALQGGCP